MHPTDDLQARGALMVARAAARLASDGFDRLIEARAEREREAEAFFSGAEWSPADVAKMLAQSNEIAARRIDHTHNGVSFRCVAVNRIREVSASDAALARAIDAVPGRG